MHVFLLDSHSITHRGETNQWSQDPNNRKKNINQGKGQGKENRHHVV